MTGDDQQGWHPGDAGWWTHQCRHAAVPGERQKGQRLSGFQLLRETPVKIPRNTQE